MVFAVSHVSKLLCSFCRFSWLAERVLEDDCVYAVCEAVKVLVVVCWPAAVTWGGRRSWQAAPTGSDNRGRGSEGGLGEAVVWIQTDAGWGWFGEVQ